MTYIISNNNIGYPALPALVWLAEECDDKAVIEDAENAIKRLYENNMSSDSRDRLEFSIGYAPSKVDAERHFKQ